MAHSGIVLYDAILLDIHTFPWAPVLGYHPHAAQVVTQAVLHLAVKNLLHSPPGHGNDFRCQVKQIIADFKAAERVAGDIPVGIVGVAQPLCARVGR